ncbi:hypothetical protein HMPREF3190_01012 [Umbribacter vaginalis]|nr:hypothetical protein HMPREF3190_01012 [Coriobacteriales bacterium DNF00809]
MRERGAWLREQSKQTVAYIKRNDLQTFSYKLFKGTKILYILKKLSY